MVVIRRLYKAAHLDQVLATFALILIFSEGTRWVFGSFPLFLDIPDALSGPVTLPGGIQYPLYRLTLIAIGLLVAVGLWALIERTRIGVQIRAALLVGLTDTLGGVFLPELFKMFMETGDAQKSGSALASMGIYILMGLVLIWKPKGLFGARS